MNTGTLLRFPAYSEPLLPVTSKYSCFSLGTFYIVSGRRLQLIESLPCKYTISGRSESSTCILSKHTGKKGYQSCAELKPIVTAHINIQCLGWRVGSRIEGSYFQKDDVSLSSMLVIVH